MPEPVIKVRNLVKKYGDLVAVDGISFDVHQGEVFAFLGPNGAGKTTTVEIIETIRAHTSGEVLLLGMDVSKNKKNIVPRIGVLPQQFSSFDRITVEETVHYYGRLFGMKNVDVGGLIHLVNLDDKKKEMYKNLSGGLKQRLGIAIALVNDPEIVFLDEPTTGLDPRARHEVWEVLEGLKKQGKTIFLTTHYMEEAELLADNLAIISKGKIIETGSPEKVVQKNAKYQLLTLRGVDDAAFNLIAGMGFEPNRNNHKNICVKVAKTDDVLAILEKLKDSKAGYVSFDVRMPNLEEVFLMLTGEALATEADIVAKAGKKGGK
ncbi:MAG: ABC transporter ATP-binding protein [Methanobacteriota archaeon]